MVAKDSENLLTSAPARIVEFIVAGQVFAVATVLAAEGSTPVEAGAKAIIDGAGRIWGTVGGGAVEAETHRRAMEANRARRPVIFDFQLTGESASESVPICGGKMRVLVDPTAANNRAAYAQAAAACQRRERGVLLTRISDSATPEVTVQWFDRDLLGACPSSVGAKVICSVLESEIPRLLVEDGASPTVRGEVFVDPLVLRPVLLIVGGGHVGQALARQADWLGFEVVVVDDRPEFTIAELFPDGVTTRCGDMAKEVAEFPVAGDTYIVLVTHGHRCDAEALAACIHRPTAYIGMIGSRRKVALLRRDFLESGRATEAEFDRVHAPIGLDIGAVTVPEIATSIAAQLIAVRRQGKAAGCSKT